MTSREVSLCYQRERDLPPVISKYNLSRWKETSSESTPEWYSCVCGCEMFDLMEKKRVFMTIDNSCAKLYLTNADGNLWSVAAGMLGRNRSRWSMSLQVQTPDWTDKLNSEQHEDELSELRTPGFGATQSSPVLGWMELPKWMMNEREICVTFFKFGNLCTMRWGNTYFKAAPQTYFSCVVSWKNLKNSGKMSKITMDLHMSCSCLGTMSRSPDQSKNYSHRPSVDAAWSW